MAHGDGRQTRTDGLDHRAQTVHPSREHHHGIRTFASVLCHLIDLEGELMIRLAPFDEGERPQVISGEPKCLTQRVDDDGLLPELWGEDWYDHR